ncbi:MAG: metallophosphoesterase [Verrucomicrobia bacterium]|nr:metallophosphoesterase [Verrucomicrobiota bacterium]
MSKTIIRFGLFADMHYADPALTSPHSALSLAKLGSCIDHFNSTQVPLAFNLGDSVEMIKESSLKIRYLEMVRKACARYSGILYAVLGNHDVETVGKQKFLSLCGSPFRETCYSVDVGKVRFIVLDGNYNRNGADIVIGQYQWDDLWLPEKQLQWLAKELQTDMPVIILCHECLDDAMFEGAMDPHIIRNSASARAIIEKSGKVIAVFEGHYHPGRMMSLNGIPYIAVTSMVLGESREKNAYAFVSVKEDGTIEVEGYGMQPSYHPDARRTLCQTHPSPERIL